MSPLDHEVTEATRTWWATTPEDASIVRDLDTWIFPDNSNDLQRADEGELEAGVLAGDVLLVAVEEKPVAYLHIDRVSEPGQVYVSGFGVLHGYQRSGLGSLMYGAVSDLLESYQEQHPVYTVTSPWNSRMFRFLLARGFAGRWILPDFFGPGRHRVGLQILRPGSPRRSTLPTRWVRLVDDSHQSTGTVGPVAPDADGVDRPDAVDEVDIHKLEKLLAEGYVICELAHGSHPDGPVFGLAEGGGGDDFLPCRRPKTHV